MGCKGKGERVSKGGRSGLHDPWKSTRDLAYVPCSAFRSRIHSHRSFFEHFKTFLYSAVYIHDSLA
jgi:hypothetical protein